MDSARIGTFDARVESEVGELRNVSEVVEPAAVNMDNPEVVAAKLAFPVPLAKSQTSIPSEYHSSGSTFSPDLARALKGVVKVFTTTSRPNFSQPWQMLSQTKSTASGFAIPPLEQRRILTNAHAVANQVQVMLRKHGNAKKYIARVLAVGHECDIAMLTVDEDEFWEGITPLPIDGLPAMQESVTVVGFPTGGDNVCVTKGVVSRIDRQQYSHGRASLLTLQIDAAINSGNSGGPVLLRGRVVGIAFQCLTVGENIGYIIPVPVINHFLQDLERHNCQYTGFCELGVSWQTLENSDMKEYLRMPAGMTGVYVTSTQPLFNASKVLKEGDVLTHFNGTEIADDGTFLFQEAVRIDFRHLVSLNFNGDVCKLMIWRDGKHQEVEVVLSLPRDVVPLHSHDVMPDYYIYGGLVFVSLSAFYLKSQYGADWQCKAPIKLCEKAIAAQMAEDGQEIVVLSKVMASPLNTGYQDLGNIQVLKINDTPVHNLAHLAHLLDTCDQDFVKFQLEWQKVLIMNHKKARFATTHILKQNYVPGVCSEGLMEKAAQLPEKVLKLGHAGDEPRETKDVGVLCNL